MSAPSSRLRLENQVAVVTGGTRGIGEGIVRRFAQEGAKAVFSGRSDDKVAWRNAKTGYRTSRLSGMCYLPGRSDVAGQQPFFGVSIEISDFDTSKSFPSPTSIELTFLSRFQTWFKQPRDPGVFEKSAVNLRDF